MTDQLQDTNQQLMHSKTREEHKSDTEVNDEMVISTAVESSSLSANHLAATQRASTAEARDHFRDYVDNTCFESLVSIVQDAPNDSLPARFPCSNMEAKDLHAIFERVRKYAVHKRLTTVKEAILFAVADMFVSESKASSWYGPRLVSKVLAVGSHRARYFLLRLVWNAFSAHMRLNMSVESTTQLLKGLLIVIQEASQPPHNNLGKSPTDVDKEGRSAEQTLKANPDSKPADQFLLQGNPSIAFKILRLFVRHEQIRDFMNGSDDFLTIADSLLSNPMTPGGVFCECLCFTAKLEGFLGALDRKHPLGTVPQVIMHVAEYCMGKSGPSWSVPRFLTKEKISNGTFKRTSILAFAAVKSFAASIDRQSLFFEPLCDSVMRMYAIEALEDKGTIMGQVFGNLLGRFSSSVPLRDEFMVQLISGIHSCKDEIAELVDTLLSVIIEQYPQFVEKHVDAICKARNIRKLLQDSLDGNLDYFPEMPEDW